MIEFGIALAVCAAVALAITPWKRGLEKFDTAVAKNPVLFIQHLKSQDPLMLTHASPSTKPVGSGAVVPYSPASYTASPTTQLRESFLRQQELLHSAKSELFDPFADAANESQPIHIPITAVATDLVSVQNRRVPAVVLSSFVLRLALLAVNKLLRAS